MSTYCKCCERLIEDNWPRVGTPENPICMRCEGIEIEVYKITHNKTSYLERDLGSVNALLEDMEIDTCYSITKLKMPFARYIELPEFQGF